MAHDTDSDEELATLVRTRRLDVHTFVERPLATMVPERAIPATGPEVLALLKGFPRAPGELKDEGVLGVGGMGAVGLATQVALGRKVAVKRLKADRRAPRHVEALLTEARLSGALEHPNIVPVHDLWLDADGLPVLVMKRIEGEPWSTLLLDTAELARLTGGRASLEEHLRIFQQVCHALHFAHARGVVHRDLKPDNVMVGAFGEVAVVDWGVATPMGPLGDVAGTPAYMAPEMLRATEQGLTARTDVYLLGATLFHVLTGRPPHQGPSFTALARRILNEDVVVPPEVPAELAGLLRRCLARDADQRPGSAEAVRLEVEDFLGHQGSRDLTRQAQARLGELLALLDTPGADVQRSWALFSECRFGFQQALRSWPGNAEAQGGLSTAARRMVQAELARGAAASAQGVLGDVQPPDAALAAQVQEALAKEGEQARRLAALEKAHDPGTGLRARVRVAVGAGLFWVFTPLLRLVRPPENETLSGVPVALLSAGVLAVMGYGLRRFDTPLNRGLWKLMLYMMLVQAAGLWSLNAAFGDLGPLTVTALCLYWAFVGSVITLLLVPGNWVAVLGFLLGGWAAQRWPEHRYAAISVANAVFALNSARLIQRRFW